MRSSSGARGFPPTTNIGEGTRPSTNAASVDIAATSRSANAPSGSLCATISPSHGCSDEWQSQTPAPATGAPSSSTTRPATNTPAGSSTVLAQCTPARTAIVVFVPRSVVTTSSPAGSSLSATRPSASVTQRRPPKSGSVPARANHTPTPLAAVPSWWWNRSVALPVAAASAVVTSARSVPAGGAVVPPDAEDATAVAVPTGAGADQSGANAGRHASAPAAIVTVSNHAGSR
jgi:hypothetical protein